MKKLEDNPKHVSLTNCYHWKSSFSFFCSILVTPRKLANSDFEISLNFCKLRVQPWLISGCIVPQVNILGGISMYRTLTHSTTTHEPTQIWSFEGVISLSDWESLPLWNTLSSISTVPLAECTLWIPQL